MRAVVVRHYRTVNNKERRIMGWADAPPAENWEADIRALQQSLQENVAHFDAYYSSALRRSRNTAACFAHHRGHYAVHGTASLNEVNYGTLRHKHKRWVADHYPEYKTDADFVFPEGESFRQMQRRSVDYVLSRQSIHAGHTLLLVLHAGVIRGLICHFLGLDFTNHLKRKISHKYVGEFIINNDHCESYNEFGQPSGFVKDGVLTTPVRQKFDLASERSKAKVTTSNRHRSTPNAFGEPTPQVSMQASRKYSASD